MTAPTNPVNREAEKAARAALRRAPESIGAIALSVLWSLGLLTLGGGFGGLLVVLFIVGLAAGATLLTIHTGSDGFAVSSAAFLCVVSVGVVGSLDMGPIAVAAAASSIIVYLDLIRLNFARRRTESLDEALVVRTLATSGVVAALSIVTMIAVVAATGDTNTVGSRSWIWVPIAAAALIIPAAALIIASTRRSGAHDKRRWQPGERMLPRPNAD